MNQSREISLVCKILESDVQYFRREHRINAVKIFQFLCKIIYDRSWIQQPRQSAGTACQCFPSRARGGSLRVVDVHMNTQWLVPALSSEQFVPATASKFYKSKLRGSNVIVLIRGQWWIFGAITPRWKSHEAASVWRQMRFFTVAWHSMDVGEELARCHSKCTQGDASNTFDERRECLPSTTSF